MWIAKNVFLKVNVANAIQIASWKGMPVICALVIAYYVFIFAFYKLLRRIKNFLQKLWYILLFVRRKMLEMWQSFTHYN